MNWFFIQGGAMATMVSILCIVMFFNIYSVEKAKNMDKVIQSSYVGLKNNKIYKVLACNIIMTVLVTIFFAIFIAVYLILYNEKNIFSFIISIIVIFLPFVSPKFRSISKLFILSPIFSMQPSFVLEQYIDYSIFGKILTYRSFSFIVLILIMLYVYYLYTRLEKEINMNALIKGELKKFFKSHKKYVFVVALLIYIILILVENYT